MKWDVSLTLRGPDGLVSFTERKQYERRNLTALLLNLASFLPDAPDDHDIIGIGIEPVENHEDK